MSPGRHSDFRNLGTVEPQCLRGESLEEIVRQDWRLQGRPNGKAGNEGLREDDEASPRAGRLGDQVTRLVRALGGIEIYRRRMTRGSLETGIVALKHDGTRDVI